VLHGEKAVPGDDFQIRHDAVKTAIEGITASYGNRAVVEV
jgi:hypothetical protein